MLFERNEHFKNGISENSPLLILMFSFCLLIRSCCNINLLWSSSTCELRSLTQRQKLQLRKTMLMWPIFKILPSYGRLNNNIIIETAVFRNLVALLFHLSKFIYGYIFFSIWTGITEFNKTTIKLDYKIYLLQTEFFNTNVSSRRYKFSHFKNFIYLCILFYLIFFL